MKAVVLARGLGRRMREGDAEAMLEAAQQQAAAVGQKAMMPVGGAKRRPFLDYVLGALADAGCTDVCLVVAPDHAEIREHYERNPPSRLRLHHAVQAEPTGTAHAVLAARDFTGADSFLALNADNLYPVEVLRALVAMSVPGLPAFDRSALVGESHFPADRVAQFAMITVDADGWLTGIREKPAPDDPAVLDACALVSMNVWRFDAGIFGVCRDVARSPRGEFELPGAVALAVARGARFKVIRARGAVLDLSRQGDVAQVSRRLQGLEPRP